MEPNKETAKVFWSGRSQAVRLPKSFRFEGETVRIRKHGNAVILEPIAEDWQWLDVIAGTMTANFMEHGREQPALPVREGLDDAFGQ
jgi:antitoxin VapB